MYKNIIGLATIAILCIAPSYALQEVISFDKYIQYIENLEKFSNHISAIELHTQYRQVQNKACTREQDKQYFYLEPVCFYQNHLPPMEFVDVVDSLRDQTIGFNNVYNTAPAESFHYEGTTPIYRDNKLSNFLLLKNSQAHKAMATFHSIEQDKIQVPKYIIAQIYANEYTFYASYNDTSMRKGCAGHNYSIALKSMDKVLLYPGDILNFNRHISGLDYCTGRGRTDLQFYGGVCGASSQLYRISLLAPHIQITQRHGHSERRGAYYGNEITGDDAAIYEMHKQFEIKNNDTRGLYFRTIQEKDYDYLVAIKPYKATHGVKITRERETKLKTNLTKSVYQMQNINHYIQEFSFPTRYLKKNNTIN